MAIVVWNNELAGALDIVLGINDFAPIACKIHYNRVASIDLVVRRNVA